MDRPAPREHRSDVLGGRGPALCARRPPGARSSGLSLPTATMARSWPTPSRRRVLVAGATLVVAAALFVSPVWGVVALGPAAAAILLRRRWRWGGRIVELTGLVLACAVALSVLWVERRDRPFPNAGWTAAFDHLNGLAAFAVMAVAVGAVFAADAVGERVRPRRHPARADNTMRDRFRRHPDRTAALVLALMAYVPILLTRPGRGQRRHQVLSHPRSVCGAAAGRVDVGPIGRSGNRSAPEHRLSLPARPLLLADGSDRFAGLADTASPVGNDGVRSRVRDVPHGPVARLDLHRSAGGGLRLRVQPVPAELSRPPLGDPRALGGDAVDGPPRCQGGPDPIVEAGCPVRRRRGARRKCQCDVTRARRARPRDLARHRRRGGPGPALRGVRGAAKIACSVPPCRCGGSWRCGSRGPTGSRFCGTPRPTGRLPVRVPRPRSSAASATGSSTVATDSTRGSNPPDRTSTARC